MLAKVLVCLIFRVLVVRESGQVAMVDCVVAETGWCSARIPGFENMPAIGFHVGYMRGPFVAIRTETTNERSERGEAEPMYTIYALGSAAARAISRSY